MRNGLLALGITCVVTAYAQKDIAWDIRKDIEVAKVVEKSIGLVHHAGSEKLVKSVGNRLVSKLEKNPYEFSFEIVDQPEPNAFALPGGHVYVSRGLLALLVNEDELAGVLGHEIMHVIQRHSAKQQRKILPTIFAAPGVILGSAIGGSLGEKVAAPLLGAGQVILSSHSRKQETEADQLGIELAARAGYQPARLADILHRIEQWTETESGKKARFSLLNDHPMTPERMKAIGQHSQSIQINSIASLYKPQEFERSVDSLLYGPNPAKGIFEKNTFYHPVLDLYWELPAGWKYVNETSAAGGMKDNRQIILTIAGKERQLDTLIENFVNGYYRQTRHKPISDKKVAMKGREGAELIIAGSDNKNLVYTLWFKKGGYTWVILGVGEDTTAIPTFRESALTFRDLQASDYKNIRNENVLSVMARAGETLTALARRSGNISDESYLALMNGVEPTYTCKTTERMKIIVVAPYKKP